MLDSIDFIELPGRGRCNIYCARYTYDPLKQSPNENPEAELGLNAGDYVIIYGEMDEVKLKAFTFSVFKYYQINYTKLKKPSLRFINHCYLLVQIIITLFNSECISVLL